MLDAVDNMIETAVRSDKHCRIRTLSPLNLEKDVQLYEVQLRGIFADSVPGTRKMICV